MLAPNQTSKSSTKREQQFICHYPACQQYVAVILVPLIRTFHAPSLRIQGLDKLKY